MKHRPAPASARRACSCLPARRNRRTIWPQAEPFDGLPAKTISTASDKRSHALGLCCLSPVVLGTDTSGFWTQKASCGNFRVSEPSTFQNKQPRPGISRSRRKKNRGKSRSTLSQVRLCAQRAPKQYGRNKSGTQSKKSKAAGSISPPAARFSYLNAVVIALYVLGETAAGPPNTKACLTVALLAFIKPSMLER